MTEDAIRKVVADYFAATRAMDGEAWVSTFAEDAESYDPVGAPPHRGHEALRQFFQGIVSAFDKIGLTENDIFVAGGQAAVSWTGRGTGKNGREVAFGGIDIFKFDDEGKIKSLYSYWDPARMMAELQG